MNRVPLFLSKKRIQRGVVEFESKGQRTSRQLRNRRAAVRPLDESVGYVVNNRAARCDDRSIGVDGGDSHRTHTFGVNPPGLIPRDKLKRVEIPIVGLACKACSMAVYDILAGIDGVEQATASLRDGLAVAWIDRAKTNRESLEAALQNRRVTLASP